jgi:2-polyprenyl-6-methoxyphenol hydroxylase-like FAD-dependent oxidoreductase
MGSSQPANVLIAGAGPAGLILAHELLRRGVRVRLAEKRPGPSHTTRAFTLHARTMEMFEHIGVAHRLEEVCLPCPGNVYHFQGMPEDRPPLARPQRSCHWPAPPRAPAGSSQARRCPGPAGVSPAVPRRLDRPA